MEFIISRASDRSDEISPHPDAVAKLFEHEGRTRMKWVIQIDDLAALLRLTSEDELIVSDTACGIEGVPGIVIYDGYVE